MRSVISFFVSLILLFPALMGRLLPAAEAVLPGDCPATEVTLPLEGGRDPWYAEHDGVFYYCYSIGSGVAVRTSDSVATLGAGEETVAYRAPGGTPYSLAWWAPEMHYLDGAWYIYAAASDGSNETHRMYVLKSDSPTGPYEMLGKLADETDRWAIDGTVLTLGDELYFVWSGWEGETDTGQNLYIARMSDPARIDGPRVRISKPFYLWEKSVQAINEGPAALTVNGATYIVYSANASWTDDYCLGMLRLTGEDPLEAGAWAKCPVPVLKARDTAYGPGHCSFLELEGQRYIIYHANVESGTGWGGRTVRIQPYRVLGNIPVFGRPLQAGDTVLLPEKESIE
jgi:GH43 family beta-xylosidase